MGVNSSHSFSTLMRHIIKYCDEYLLIVYALIYAYGKFLECKWLYITILIIAGTHALINWFLIIENKKP